MVTSLGLSKKLAEAGLKIETEKWWVEFKNKSSTTPDKIFNQVDTLEGIDKFHHFIEIISKYPAPSTDELLAVMPQYIYDRQNMLTIVKNDNETYWVGYSNHKEIAYKKTFSEKSLSEALGKMCLWLFSIGHIYSPEKKMILIHHNE